MISRMYKGLYALSKHPVVHGFMARALPYRLWMIVFIHLLLFSLSYVLAMLMLHDGGLEGESLEILERTVLPVVLIRLAFFWYHDLYQGLWRFVSFQDLLNIIRATLLSSILFIFLGLLWRPLRIPEKWILLDFTFCVMLTGGIRFMVRNIRETWLHTHAGSDTDHILLVGPIGKIQPLVKEFIGDPNSRYNPVSIVDPEKEEDTSRPRICDVPVFSFGQISSQKLRPGRVKAIVFCWPEATRKQLDTAVEALSHFQIPFKTVPQVEDILSGKVRISDIRDVEIEDLLERSPVQIEMDRVSGYLKHKTVLVTGGGGSIGSELCRQIAGFHPSRLVIVERSENSLYGLRLELRNKFPGLDLYASVSSINDGPGLRTLLKRINVDVVFHTAAYKHVPLMETAPVESAYNNILGTYNLVQASLETGVKRFVMISTDKAVNPTNVMGVTKRIAEMIVQSHNESGKTRFMTVRFGNVLGSAGSVIPIFKRQIQRGESLTVTHPEIERFFMTIPEAVQLVLQAGCMGQGGEVFVLDMGKPVKILNLAEKLITLSGKRPYEDIEIAFTGLRPGEKMYEELLNRDERRMGTPHPQILVAASAPVRKAFVVSQIQQIKELVSRHDEKSLRKKFGQLLPSYPYQAEETRDIPNMLAVEDRAHRSKIGGIASTETL